MGDLQRLPRQVEAGRQDLEAQREDGRPRVRGLERLTRRSRIERQPTPAWGLAFSLLARRLEAAAYW